MKIVREEEPLVAGCLTVVVQSSVMVNRGEIRRRRMELGLTLHEAADRAGFSGRQRWSGIEQGERRNLSVATIAAVAKALGCSIEVLLMPARGSVTGRKTADKQQDRASKK